MTRRDFINGLLVASSLGAGPGLVGPGLIGGAFSATEAGACGDVIGQDPRAMRGGNLPGVFTIAHWLRDARLQFGPRQVTLSPGCDGQAGTFDIVDDGASFDVIIAGGGIAGLSAAFHLLRRRPATKILLLDANDHFGGNASRDSGGPLPVMGSTAGAYCAAPDNDMERDLYRHIGIEWEQFKLADPVYNFFFDEHTPGIVAGHRGWNIDTYGRGLDSIPYRPEILADLRRCRDDLLRWSATEGGPTDPPDASSPRFDYLSQMTFEDYLTKVLHCDPIVSDFYTRYTVDCLGGTCGQISAHGAINFLSSDYQGDLFTFPGGTSEIAQRLLRWLTQSGGALATQANAVALKVDVEPSNAPRTANVVYFKDGAFHRASAARVILATGSHSARHLVGHLVDAERQKGWDSVKMVPALVASVAIRSAAPLHDLGLGYDQYWWGSQYWADFVVADWATKNRHDRDRPTVLTFYGGNTAPADELAGERMKLLSTPFSAYENSLRDDLSRILATTSFDFDRDVTSISLYRWGHSMLMPTTDSLFGAVRGANGRLDRARSPRHVAFAALGPISFAGQDSEGTPSVESAIGSGFRAANEALDRL